MQILKPVAVVLIALAPLAPLKGTTALAAARPSDKAAKKEPDRAAAKKDADKPAKKELEKSAKKDDKPKKEPEKAAKREPERPATKPAEHPAKAAAEKPAAKPVEGERGRIVPGAPAPGLPAAASRIPVAAPAEIERNAILSDLAWTGDYQGGAATDAPAAAVKAFQKRNGSRETGVLSIDDRAKLAQAAKARQEQAGWRVIDDPATGARLGIPENLVSLSAPGKSGSRWQSRHGEVQVETFRAAEAGTTIGAVFAQQKVEPAERKVEFNQLRGDSFIISGLQGLKKFQVRAQAANGEVRGIAVSYDQALEGTMDRISAAISSTYAAFPPRTISAAVAPRRKIEYGTGVVVNNAGYIVTDLDLLSACDLIVVPGFGPAERVAEDKNASLALVRLNGVHGLAAVGVAPAEARAARAARAAAMAAEAAAAAAAKAAAAASEGAALAAAAAKREEAIVAAAKTAAASAAAAQPSGIDANEQTAKADSGNKDTAGANLDSAAVAVAEGDAKTGEAPTGGTAGAETAKGAEAGAAEREAARTEQPGEGAGQKVSTESEAAKATNSAEIPASSPPAEPVKAEVQRTEVAKVTKPEVQKTEQPVSTNPAVRAVSPVATIPAPSTAAIRPAGVAPPVVTPTVVDASAPDTSVAVVGIADPQVQGGGRMVSTLRGSVAANGIAMTIDPAPVMGFAGAAAVDNNGYLAGIVTQHRAAGTFQPALAPSTAVAQFLSAQNVSTSGGHPALDEVKAATVRVVCVRN